MGLDIKTLFEDVNRCQRCPNLVPWGKFPSDTHGRLNASAMIVSEAPGTRSLRRGKFWRGQAGQRIRKVLSEFNVTIEDVFYLTDIVKCGPPNDRTPTREEINNCKDYFTREIAILNPKYILVFGRGDESHKIDGKINGELDAPIY